MVILKVYGISFGRDSVLDLDHSKIFTKRKDAEACKKYIETKFKTTVHVVPIEINEYYDNDIWYEKWGFWKSKFKS